MNETEALFQDDTESTEPEDKKNKKKKKKPAAMDRASAISILNAHLSETTDGSAYAVESITVSTEKNKPTSGLLILKHYIGHTQEIRRIWINSIYKIIKTPKKFVAELEKYFFSIGEDFYTMKTDEWNEKVRPAIKEIIESGYLPTHHETRMRVVLYDFMAEHPEPPATKEDALNDGSSVWMHINTEDKKERYRLVWVQSEYFEDWIQRSQVHKDIRRDMSPHDVENALEVLLVRYGIPEPCYQYHTQYANPDKKMKCWLMPGIDQIRASLLPSET